MGNLQARLLVLQVGKCNWKIAAITTLTQTNSGSIQLTNKPRKFHINNYVIKLTDVISIFRPILKKGLSFHSPPFFWSWKRFKQVILINLKVQLHGVFLVKKKEANQKFTHNPQFQSTEQENSYFCHSTYMTPNLKCYQHLIFVYNLPILFHLIVHSVGFTYIQKHNTL